MLWHSQGLKSMPHKPVFMAAPDGRARRVFFTNRSLQIHSISCPARGYRIISDCAAVFKTGKQLKLSVFFTFCK